MDNAAIHKAEILKKLLLDKINIIYTAAYSPELNPIELIWSEIK